MISPPAGWLVERTGGALLLSPPEGPERAVFRYVEHRTPLRRAIDLARDAPLPRGFVERAISPPRRLTTFEGEHAALLTRTGAIDGRDVSLVHGYVFLDDYHASLDGLAPGPAEPLAAVAEALVCGDLHLLGKQRRRRFVYAPPPGWFGVGDRFEARWFPPGAPRDPARILVNAALPRTLATIAEIVDALGLEVARPHEAIATRAGLEGELHFLRRGAAETFVWFLADEQYLYAVRADDAFEIGRALVETIEPVPGARPPALETFPFWAD